MFPLCPFVLHFMPFAVKFYFTTKLLILEFFKVP